MGSNPAKTPKCPFLGLILVRLSSKAKPRHRIVHVHVVPLGHNCLSVPHQASKMICFTFVFLLHLIQPRGGFIQNILCAAYLMVVPDQAPIN